MKDDGALMNVWVNKMIIILNVFILLMKNIIMCNMKRIDVAIIKRGGL